MDYAITFKVLSNLNLESNGAVVTLYTAAINDLMDESSDSDIFTYTKQGYDQTALEQMIDIVCDNQQ